MLIQDFLLRNSLFSAPKPIVFFPCFFIEKNIGLLIAKEGVDSVVKLAIPMVVLLVNSVAKV